MLLLIIKTFQEQRNGIHFAYNEGVENKMGGVEFFGKFVKWGGGHNKMKWGVEIFKKLQSYPPPPPLQLSTTE